jgi:hypothetical protein
LAAQTGTFLEVVLVVVVLVVVVTLGAAAAGGASVRVEARVIRESKKGKQTFFCDIGFPFDFMAGQRLTGRRCRLTSSQLVPFCCCYSTGPIL